MLRLPRDRAKRTLVLAIVTSVLFHLLLLGPFFVYSNFVLPTYQKRGEPLLVDIAPEKPEEKAPLGNPSRPVGPPESNQRPSPPPVPPAPRIPPAPRVPASRPAPPAPAPPQAVAKAEPPAPDALVKTPEPRPVAPTPPESRPSEAAQTPSSPAPPKVASRPPGPSIWRQPGGGGGLHGGGRGGVEGEPIPLDTPDPRYQDYFMKVRERIRANWVYPREAGDRGVEGQLLIEFHIGKDGRLEYIELVAGSGTLVLDQAALNAVKLAQPFPPVPDAISKGAVAVNGQFRYQIVSGLVNQFLR